jgi:hypothetical protein
MDGLRPDFRAVLPVPFADLVRQPVRGESGDRPAQGRRAFLSRIHKRRFAALRAAAEVLTCLPEEGEALHALMLGFYDLMHMLIMLLDRLAAPCDTMRIGTLSLSSRNVQEMVTLVDQGKVRHLDLLASHFFSKHEEDIFAELCQEFDARGQRVAIARSHAKIVTMALDDGRRYVLEGSPNLRTNHNIEQFCLSRDPELFAWYDGWLESMVSKHEVHENRG